MRQTERRIVGRGVDWLGRDHRRWVVPVTGIGVAAHAEKTREGGGGGAGEDNGGDAVRRFSFPAQFRTWTMFV